MAGVYSVETSTMQWSGNMLTVTGRRNAAASSLFPFLMSPFALSLFLSLPPSPSLSLSSWCNLQPVSWLQPAIQVCFLCTIAQAWLTEEEKKESESWATKGI